MCREKISQYINSLKQLVIKKIKYFIKKFNKHFVRLFIIDKINKNQTYEC